MTRYRFDPTGSRFTVRAFADGLLSFLGHSPTFAVADFAGAVGFADDQIARMKVDLTVWVGGLAVTGDVNPSDRREIEERMRAEVLETEAFSEAAFRAAATATDKLGPGRYRMRLAGDLSLHGVTRRHQAEVELTVYPDGIRVRGETAVRMSDHGIRPVTAQGGTIRLKDEVRLAFDLVAVPEAS